MKITWFGGMAMRVQIGGEIIVIAPGDAAEPVDRGELEAGADRVLDFAVPDLEPFDANIWQRRRPQSLLETDEATKPVLIWRLQRSGMVIEAIDEPLLVVAKDEEELPWGRWADDAVLVLSSAEPAFAALEAARPRMVALTGGQESLDETIEALRPHLGRTPLQVLERGLAIEV